MFLCKVIFIKDSRILQSGLHAGADVGCSNGGVDEDDTSLALLTPLKTPYYTIYKG